jgi:hypothetical protein
MKKAEIEHKFDEIVAFAEVEKFIDTPVKRYSSGMYMRLAFAVAAHLEPEILIVDEVLAVGDADFQKKCLGRMGDFSKEGRTVLFVSHNMDAIQRLCFRCAYLEQGMLVRYGETNDVIQHYLEQKPDQVSPGEWFDLSATDHKGTGEVRIIAVQYQSPRREVRYQPYSDGPLDFALILNSDASRSLGSLAVTLYTRLGTKLVNADIVTLGQAISLQKGLNLVRIRIEKLYLNPGIYTVGLWASPMSFAAFDFIEAAFEIEVIQSESKGFGVRVEPDGAVTCHMELLEVSHSVDLPLTRENSNP